VVHGLWQYQGYATWRALRGRFPPYFVFTHGMLDPWFKRQYPLKHLKKWLYWPWGEYRVLRDARGVLFTCEEEARQAPRSFWLYRARPLVVGFGIAPPDGDPAVEIDAFHRAFPGLKDKEILLFLGRIHPKKGCDLLIEAFARAAAGSPSLHLVMAGPDGAGWQAELVRLAADRGVADRVTWTGMIDGDVKWGALRAASAFVLPSHQENFGVAVVEAMACGTPVLISDKVNIWREIVADRAGLAAPDTLAGTHQLLTDWAALAPAERALMKGRAQAASRERFGIASTVRRLVNAIVPPQAGIDIG
jgi:glycosyltransferase involved in cell wall biosynthesis